jgi:hypothetical protein
MYILQTMEATYHLNLDELTPEFIAALKTTFHATTQNVTISLHLDSEPVNAELLRRIHNIERGEDLVSFGGEEFTALVAQLLAQSPRQPVS